MNLVSLRGTSKETWEHVAASRKRPDEDWQEVFWTEKEDAEPAWYCTGIWKLPILGNEQAAELADGNDFVFLAWKGTLPWVSCHCRAPTKCILAVCLLPLIPDHVHFATTSVAPGMCDPWPSGCSWLFHLVLPPVLQKSSPELPRSKQITCKAEATQQCIDSYIFRPQHTSSWLWEGAFFHLRWPVERCYPPTGGHSSRRGVLGSFWVPTEVPTLQSLPLCNPINTAEKALQCRGPCWGAHSQLLNAETVLCVEAETHISGLI